MSSLSGQRGPLPTVEESVSEVFVSGVARNMSHLLYEVSDVSFECVL